MKFRFEHQVGMFFLKSLMRLLINTHCSKCLFYQAILLHHVFFNYEVYSPNTPLFNWSSEKHSMCILIFIVMRKCSHPRMFYSYISEENTFSFDSYIGLWDAHGLVLDLVRLREVRATDTQIPYTLLKKSIIDTGYFRSSICFELYDNNNNLMNFT